MKTDLYTEELDTKLGDMGFIIDPDLEMKEGTLSESDVIECYKNTYKALKLLLVSENIDEQKLEQAMDLATGMK